MMVFGPEATSFLCRRIKQGFGYRHPCLGSEFRISTNGSFLCTSCGNIYENFEALEIANRGNTEPTLFDERLAANG